MQLLRSSKNIDKQLTEQELAAWQALLHTHHHVMVILDAELRTEHGLTLTQYDVLLRLRRAPEGSLRMVDIANRILMSPSGLTRVVDGMVRDKLLERRRCGDDARVVWISLTEKGLNKLRAAAKTHVRGVRQHFTGHYNNTELVRLTGLLEVVSGAHESH